MGRLNAGNRMLHFVGCAFTANLIVASWLGIFASTAEASPALVVDATSGSVLYQQDATEPWYPASLTKLMTLYVTLSAVRDHRISLDTPLVVSARAAAMPPSKMGFVPGTQVTLDNALKMLLVRSANDLAISVAEGVSGSVEAFADDMNAAAAQLGMRESHFVNPNGLPDPRHVSSARDMAILARALYVSFPDHADLFNLGALALGSEIITNHNNLLGRYPGADGMKTGFTCPAGFNIVASATRGNQKLIVVVLGAPTVPLRTLKVSALFDRGFGGVDRPIAQLAELGPSAGNSAPDMRDQICRRRGKAIVQFNAEINVLQTPLVAEAGPAIANPASSPSFPFVSNSLFHAAATPVLTRIDLVPRPIYSPVPVYVGAAPGYIGPVAAVRPAHSPLGTELPPETASAYAAPASTLDTAKNPLKPDPTALPIKGRHAPVVAARPKAKTVVAKAVPEKETEKPDVAVKPAKKAVAKKTTKEASSEKPKPAKIKEAAKTDHAKDHAANTKPKTGKGVAAKAE